MVLDFVCTCTNNGTKKHPYVRKKNIPPPMLILTTVTISSKFHCHNNFKENIPSESVSLNVPNAHQGHTKNLHLAPPLHLPSSRQRSLQQQVNSVSCVGNTATWKITRLYLMNITRHTYFRKEVKTSRIRTNHLEKL